jgi:hypothetical protein
MNMDNLQRVYDENLEVIQMMNVQLHEMREIMELTSMQAKRLSKQRFKLMTLNIEIVNRLNIEVI